MRLLLFSLLLSCAADEPTGPVDTSSCWKIIWTINDHGIPIGECYSHEDWEEMKKSDKESE